VAKETKHSKVLDASNKESFSALGQDDIARAIELLKTTKIHNSGNHHVSRNSSPAISPSERNKFISQFTEVLNSELKKKTNDSAVVNHFEQSLKGLSNLMVNVSRNDVNSMDQVSLKQLINSIGNESELLNVFDSLIHAGNLKLSSFRLILMNKNCFDLNHILNKFTFLDPSGDEYVNFKILLVIKAMVLGEKKLAYDLYHSNISTWISNYESGKFSGSILLTKSLFQIIYKVDRDLKLLQSLHYSNSSLILLIESLPRQINHYIENIFDTTSSSSKGEIKLSRNQQHFVKFISILTKHATSPESAVFIKRLIKSSVTNKLRKERPEDDADLTMFQYRFHNELVSISEELSKSSLGQDKELVQLARELGEGDELISGELLKFI
jgi:hypothetical protein